MDFPPEKSSRIQLTLFIAGDAPNSHLAWENLQEICSGALADLCEIRVVDVYREFDKALQERIVVTPTLIVVTENPVTRAVFYGSLHDKDVVQQYLNIGKNGNG